ncbi:hypothetical protein GCM10009789_58750 [Kribbella sancticallisti]|uniref:Uncharacterized protein n=1 Tax=Kribbella sancticallisti TaxID=460087 RepID=A0ABN2E6X0_9ACTN
MTDWYTENRQNRQLEELRDEMSQAMYEASNLRSRLSQVQGGLESRLGRLATAFDAFVELSDIRYELIGFADAAELRRHAGQVLSALASGEQPPAPVRQVPGYWLAPALTALRALADDAIAPTAVATGAGVGEAPGAADPAGAGDALGEAMKLDERRTAVFLCLALASLGRRNQVQVDWLETAFGSIATDWTVTRVQRALWTTGARGGFGVEGQNLSVDRLQAQVTGSSTNWLEAVESRATPVATTGPNFVEITPFAKAQARLRRIRAAVETITGDTAVLEPDRDLAYAAGEPDPDSTSALLRTLISEGSDPERAPLARVAELRAKITDTAEKDNGSIEDPAGTIEDLLKADLRGADEPHLAATALRVVAGGVLANAEELAKTASSPSPHQVTSEIDWQQITLTADGPDQQSMTTASANISSSAPSLSVNDLAGPLTYAGVGALVGIGLGLLHWFWILVGLASVVFGLYQYWRARTRAAQAKAEATARIATLRENATAAAAELATYQSQHANRTATITTDLDQLRKHLAA